MNDNNGLETTSCPVSVDGLERINESLDRMAEALEEIARCLALATEELPLERIAENTNRVAGCLSLGLDDLAKIRKFLYATAANS